jgi:hypothetical protein
MMAKKEKKPQLLLLVEVDSNDGDYETNEFAIKEKELERVRPVIEAIAKFKPYKVKNRGIEWPHSRNYPYGDCHRDDLGEKSAEELYGHIKGFEEFNEMVPQGEYGIHTITRCELREVVLKEKLI